MIETTDLTRTFKSVVALDRLNLQVAEGEIFGYIGPNGAGKTTTIRILSGLLRPTRGQARIAGVDVVAHPRQARQLVGYLPDSFGVYAGMRVWEYLDFFGATYRIPRAQRKERMDHVLNLTGIELMSDYFVETLSHGMRQRVGLAKTLMHDPKVLMLDEPTNGLDPRARIEIRDLLKQLKALGKTIIVSSHILPELASVCDRIGIIERGELLTTGTVEEVMQAVRHQRVIDIEVTANPQSAALLLQERYHEDDCAVMDIIERVIRVSFAGDDADMAGMLRLLTGEGHPVVRFNEVMMDLEEIYMKVTESARAGQRKEEG